MRMLLLGLVTCVTLAFSPGATQAQPSTPDGRAMLDAVELPVSLERIKRRLEALPETTEGRNLLRLNYYLAVYGRAPAINITEGFDLHTGPVPYGAASGTEMLRAVTPPRWRPAAATFSLPR